MENLLGFWSSRQGNEEKWEGNSLGLTGGSHLFDANNVKAKAHQPVRDVLGRGIVWEVAYHCLQGFFILWEKGEVGQVVIVEVGLDGLEICHDSRDDSSSVSCVTELEILTYHTFQLSLQLNKVNC
jgi:hypothetical protein